MKKQLILIACLVVASMTASAQEVDEYRVRAGDTCGNIARRHYGHSRRYDLIHEANPELGPMPHRLEAGMVLRLPRAQRQPAAEATVTALRRDVRHQRPQAGEWGRSRVGQELGRGWHVSTGARSSAELTFPRSAVANVREETLVVIYGGVARRVRHEGGRAVIRRGAMLSRLSALSGGQPIEVETPAALATLGTGEALVDVTSGGETRVSVHDGDAATVARPTGEGSVRVRAGMGTHVSPGRPPRRPRRLPPAPSFREGERRFIGLSGHGGTIRAAWDAVTAARRYRVEIARRRDGRDLILAAVVESSVRSFEFHRLPPGTYFARVHTIDEEHFEGRASEPLPLMVVGAELIFPGASEPARAPQSEDPFGLGDLDSGLGDADLESPSVHPPTVPQYSGLRFGEGVRCRLGASDAVAELRLTELGLATIECESDDGPVGGVAAEVVQTAARLSTLEGEPIETLARGLETQARVRFEPTFDDVSGLTLALPRGVTMSELTPHPEGGLSVRLTTTDDVAERVVLGVVTNDQSRLPLAEVSAGVPRGVPSHLESGSPAGDPEARAVQEGFGLAAFPSAVGLRDERRGGSGAHLGVTIVSAEGMDPEARVRVSGGARVALFEDRLRFDVAVPLDLMGQNNRPHRASRDLYGAVSSRILNDFDLGIGLAAEVGMWAPTAGQDGLDRGRLSVAADFSIRLMDDEHLTIRTRQAGLFEFVDNGALLWASAYGVDVWVAGPFSAGAEVDLVIGRAAGRDDWFAAGIGLAVLLEVDALTISLAGRLGFGDVPMLGAGAATLAVRGTHDLGDL